MLQTLTCNVFQDHVNKPATIHTDQAAVDAVLIEAKVMGSAKSEEGQRQAFSVVFRTSTATQLPQGTYRIDTGLGELTLFLVPIGPDGDGARYEAIFG